MPLAVVADEPAPAEEEDRAGRAARADEPAAPRRGRRRRRAGAGRGGGEADVEGARLVALNMALNGTSREETDRYLAENFDLADRGALLDEVYATVES